MALSFNGTTQYLEVSGSPVADSPVTLAAWVNQDGIAGNRRALSLSDVSDANRRISLSRFDTFVRGNGNDGSTNDVVDSGAITADVWEHYCYAEDGTNRYAWHNGGSKTTETPNLASFSGIDTTVIGALHNSGGVDSFFSGALAELSVYAGILTDDEVAALAKMISPQLVRRSILVGYWPLLSDILDYSGNGLDMTAFNGPTEVDHPGGWIYPTRTYFCPAAEVAVPAPTAYYPSTANSTGYKIYDAAAPPDTRVADNETEYDGAERTEASDDDGNGVNSMETNSGHRVTYVFTETDITKLEITARMETAGGGLVTNATLYIWNYTDVQWDLLQARANIVGAVEYTFHDSIYYDLGDYISSSTVHFLLQRAGGTAVGTFELNYTELNVTGTAAGGFVPYPRPRGFAGGVSNYTGGVAA